MTTRNLMAFISMFFVSISAISEEKPTRSECIVGYALNWTKVKADSNLVRIQMATWRTGDRNISELAGMTMKPDGSRLYLQYRSRCEDRTRMSADLIGIWESMGLDLPAFERLPDPIEPSTDTIDLRGPDWH